MNLIAYLVSSISVHNQIVTSNLSKIEYIPEPLGEGTYLVLHKNQAKLLSNFTNEINRFKGNDVVALFAQGAEF